jgi:hypothetical protein
MRKTAPHQKCSSTMPPITGPTAPPAEKPATQMPMARVRSVSLRNMLRIKDSVDGASVAAERPSRARATMRSSAVGAKAAMSDIVPKHAAPIISNFRRPIRSPSVPIVISAPATMKP